MAQKRTKPVNIRVSEDEFEKLHEACGRMGTRNVSELAREAMRLIVEEHRSAVSRAHDPIVWLNELSARLTSLHNEVDRLKSLLSAKK
jgi:hypothetical protein